VRVINGVAIVRRRRGLQSVVKASDERFSFCSDIGLIPEVGRDVGSDDDVAPSSNGHGSLDLGTVFINIRPYKEFTEGDCLISEVVQDETGFSIISVEPLGVRGLGEILGVDGEVVELSELTGPEGLARSRSAVEHNNGAREG